MKIAKVTDKRSERQFPDVAREVYKNDAVWVCPPDREIKAIFDPGENRYFRRGVAIRWILKDNEGRLTGRITGWWFYTSFIRGTV